LGEIYRTEDQSAAAAPLLPKLRTWPGTWPPSTLIPTGPAVLWPWSIKSSRTYLPMGATNKRAYLSGSDPRNGSRSYRILTRFQLRPPDPGARSHALARSWPGL